MSLERKEVEGVKRGEEEFSEQEIKDKTCKSEEREFQMREAACMKHSVSYYKLGVTRRKLKSETTGSSDGTG